MSPSVVKQNLGIDISKKDFKVCLGQYLEGRDVLRIKSSRTFSNSLKGFEALTKWVDKKAEPTIEVRVTVEATGVYHEQLVHYLVAQTNYAVSVILANTSKAFAQSLNLKTKTDAVDAKMLAQMGLERRLDIWQPLSDSTPLAPSCSGDVFNSSVSLKSDELPTERQFTAFGWRIVFNMCHVIVQKYDRFVIQIVDNQTV